MIYGKGKKCAVCKNGGETFRVCINENECTQYSNCVCANSV